MLDPWAFNKSSWKKKLISLYYANNSLNKANVIHALCVSEYESINTESYLEQLIDYVDDLHTLPGVEKINWENVCRALGEIDYKGEFTLEADNFLKNFDDYC